MEKLLTYLHMRAEKDAVSGESKDGNKMYTDLYTALFPIYHLIKVCGMMPVKFHRTNRRYVGEISVYGVVYG